MLKRHEIQVLLKAGHSQAEVAQLTGASLRSVKRVAKEGDVRHVDDAAERLSRGIGRPSLVEDFRKPIADLLEQERDLKSVVHRTEDCPLRGHCRGPAQGPDPAGPV